MPEISIILPVYNSEKTLEKCLASIFNQTVKNFEIIAVNDGSTDKSQDILRKYQNKITIIQQPNAGAAAARNVGAGQALGKFLIFVDSDTELKPDMLEKMKKALDENISASYAYSAFRFGGKLFKLWPFSAEKLRQMPYIHTTSLIRKNHFPGFDKKLKRFQDWDLWLTMLDRGYTGQYISEVLFSVKGGGTMSIWLPRLAYKIPFLKQVKNYRQAEKIIKVKH